MVHKPTLTIDEISAFCSSFCTLAENAIAQTKQQFKDFSVGLRRIQGQAREFERKEAPGFNVFRVLGIESWEVYTHTPFLRELLNPCGTHGQGPLFWIRFCRLLGLPEMDASHPAWRVVQWQRENVDIRIENHQLGKAMFIENKVYSGAHSGQLTTYFEIWKNQFPKGGAFVYLSIHGGIPDAAGFREHALFPKTVIINELSTISYKDDIKKWLQVCLFEIEPLRLREILRQYLDLIDYL
jgi:hypothetical protein